MFNCDYVKTKYLSAPPRPPHPPHGRRWTDQSACERFVLVTRTRVGVAASRFTVSQQALQLACGVVYTPTVAEINESLREPGLDVGAAYTYCVQVRHACVHAPCPCAHAP